MFDPHPGDSLRNSDSLIDGSGGTVRRCSKRKDALACPAQPWSFWYGPTHHHSIILDSWIHTREEWLHDQHSMKNSMRCHMYWHLLKARGLVQLLGRSPTVASLSMGRFFSWRIRTSRLLGMCEYSGQAMPQSCFGCPTPLHSMQSQPNPRAPPKPAFPPPISLSHHGPYLFDRRLAPPSNSLEPGLSPEAQVPFRREIRTVKLAQGLAGWSKSVFNGRFD